MLNDTGGLKGSIGKRWYNGNWLWVLQKFQKSINCYKYELQPPIVPKIMYEGDTSNFDDYPESDWKNSRTLEDDELKLFEDFWYKF